MARSAKLTAVLAFCSLLHSSHSITDDVERAVVQSQETEETSLTTDDSVAGFIDDEFKHMSGDESVLDAFEELEWLDPTREAWAIKWRTTGSKTVFGLHLSTRERQSGKEHIHNYLSYGASPNEGTTWTGRPIRNNRGKLSSSNLFQDVQGNVFVVTQLEIKYVKTKSSSMWKSHSGALKMELQVTYKPAQESVDDDADVSDEDASEHDATRKFRIKFYMQPKMVPGPRHEQWQTSF